MKGGTTYRILSDQVGSVRLVVNASTGVIAQRIDYDAFGVVTQDTNPGFQPFGFAGGFADHDTGLVRFGARDYDPAVGRWTSKDPIRFQGDATNLYGYSLADPANLLDSNGLWATTAEGYIPPGVPVLGGLGLRGSLGYTGDGRFFFSFGAGVGYGASFTPFDPDGEPPGYADQCRGTGPGLNLSLIGSGGFGGGLAGIDASKRLGFGVDWSRGPSPYVFNETIPPDRNLGLGSNTNRVGLSGSATVNLTFIGK